MKKLIAISAVLAAFRIFADGAAARKKFTDDNAVPFKGADAVAANAVCCTNDFERASGTAAWKIALPVKDDDRVRFLDATFTDGKFISGKLRTFGFAEETVDAARFARLRANYPMVARKVLPPEAPMKDVKVPPPLVALYPAGSRPMRRKTPAYTESMRHDPVAYAIGRFGGGLRRLGVNIGKLGYEVSFEGPSGIVTVLGTASASSRLENKHTMPLIQAAIEAKWPERKGLVSERDVADFYALGVVTYRGVLPQVSKP